VTKQPPMYCIVCRPCMRLSFVSTRGSPPRWSSPCLARPGSSGEEDPPERVSMALGCVHWDRRDWGWGCSFMDSPPPTSMQFTFMLGFSPADGGEKVKVMMMMMILLPFQLCAPLCLPGNHHARCLSIVILKGVLLRLIAASCPIFV